MKITVTAYRGVDAETGDTVLLAVLEPAEGEVPDTRAMRGCAAAKATLFAEAMFSTPHQIIHDIATGQLPSGAMIAVADELIAQPDTVQLWQVEHTGDVNPNGPPAAGETIH